MEAIADAIREKTGKTEAMYPREMAGEIEAIDTGEADEVDAEWLMRTLKRVDIPDGVTEIRDYKFYGCGNLASISLPETLTSIGARAFDECRSLLLTTLPNTISNIDESAFLSCERLALTRLPESLTDLKSGTFYGCTNFSITRIPASCVSIESYVMATFGKCTSLKEITFEHRLESYTDNNGRSGGMFYNCSNLRTINVPWSEGEIPGAPWGAVNATINYDYHE